MDTYATYIKKKDKINNFLMKIVSIQEDTGIIFSESRNIDQGNADDINKVKLKINAKIYLIDQIFDDMQEYISNQKTEEISSVVIAQNMVVLQNERKMLIDLYDSLRHLNNAASSHEQVDSIINLNRFTKALEETKDA